MRPLLMANSVGMQGPSPFTQARFEFPPLELLDAIVFSGFAALSLILALGIFGYRAAFKQADVDVLFSTPVNPRVVLVFRIVRDYLATLLVPLLLVLLTWRPLHIEDLFRNVPHPQSAGYAIRALTIGFVLLSTTWVGMGYALSLFVNRNDRASDLRKRVIGWTLGCASLLVIAVVIRAAVQFRSAQDFIEFAHQPWLRGFFFTATPATKIVMGPLEGSTAESLLGALGLIAVSGISLYCALKQADWMYDQAAVKGFGSERMRQLQRKGDLMGVVAEAARSGKVKPRRPGWYQRLRVRGFAAMLWKDGLIQWRSVKGIIIGFTFASLMIVIMPSLFGGGRDLEHFGYVVLMMEGFIAFTIATMTSQSGFTELLRRVDLQKPMPFRPQTIVLSEVLAKAAPAAFTSLLASLVGMAMFPADWTTILAGAVFFPTMAVVICAVNCGIVLLFPEIDDPSQRGFRGLMMLLALLIVGAPGAGAFILVGWLAHSPLAGSVPAALVNLGVSFGLSLIGGGLYAGFNPSE